MNCSGIVLTGVGGQGTILASNVLGRALLAAGLDVKKAEIHGMSQRGGTVITQIRYGQKVFSPLLRKGTATVMIAFEKLEALRYADYMDRGGRIVVSDCEIVPEPVLAGRAEYPRETAEEFKRYCEDVVVLDAAKMAEDLGNKRSQNMILLGASAGKIAIPAECWEEAIADSVPKGTIEVNLKAFHKGWDVVGRPDFA